MKNLGSYTRTILKLVRESLNGLSIPSPSGGRASDPSATFNPNPSPYVFLGDETKLTFVYGVSEYGGEDVLLAPNATRSNKRYFLKLSGEEQNGV